jgi:hypothetical protein
MVFLLKKSGLTICLRLISNLPNGYHPHALPRLRTASSLSTRHLHNTHPTLSRQYVAGCTSGPSPAIESDFIRGSRV